jgi:hypothetical protein
MCSHKKSNFWDEQITNFHLIQHGQQRKQKIRGDTETHSKVISQTSKFRRGNIQEDRHSWIKRHTDSKAISYTSFFQNNKIRLKKVLGRIRVLTAFDTIRTHRKPTN